MTLPAFASHEDYSRRYGVVSDVTRTQAALERSSTLVRVEAGTSWVTGDAVDFGDIVDYLQDAIIDICLESARRALDTPTGVESEQVGDSTITYSDPTGNVYLTSQERATIRAAVTPAGGVPGLASVRVVAPAYASASRLLGDTFDEVLESDTDT